MEDHYVPLPPVAEYHYVMIPLGKSTRLWYNPFYVDEWDWAFFWLFVCDVGKPLIVDDIVLTNRKSPTN